VEDNREQGVIFRRRLEVLNWCRCKRKEIERWHGPERQRCSKVAHEQETQKAQQKKRVVKKRSKELSKY